METVLDIAAVATGSAVMAGFIWATRHHFHAETVPLGAAVVSIAALATWVLFAALLLLNRQPVELLLAGLLFQFASGALFWWAVSATRRARLRYVFDPAEPHGLVTDGPYRFVRHPFYASYITLWVGWAIATGSNWALVPAAFLVAVYTMAARREELAFAASGLARRYAAYQARTGFILPSPASLRAATGQA